MSKTISFKIEQATYDRLIKTRHQYTWKEYFMLCAIGKEKRNLEVGSDFGTKFCHDNIRQFQRELNS